MVSLLMMSVSRGGHVSNLTSSITGQTIEYMGEIYVNNTDLLTIVDGEHDKNRILQRAQANLDKWAHLLNVTGGLLNPIKCYLFAISYKYHKEQWVYNINPPDSSLTIPLPDGSSAEIAVLPVTEARKMLGVWLSPDGSDDTHLNQVVVGKVSKWVNKIKNMHLSVHLAWKAYRHQLWPGVCHGLATLANGKDMLDSILHKLEFKMLLFIVVNQHMKVEWRHLGREFGGIGLFNLAIEQLIGWIKIMLQHFHTATTLSQKITASIEALQLEVGCRGNPMNKNYAEQGLLATDCWVKVVWEWAHHYNFCIYLNYPTQHLPR